MTSRDFCFWMQGFLELRGDDAPITAEQAKCIQRHLALVFVREIDPSAGPAEHQAKLDAVHTPPSVTEERVKEIAKKLDDMRPDKGPRVMRC
jgi:hypothetical protein